MSDLFSAATGPAPREPGAAAPRPGRDRPLADLLRPRALEELAGQDHLLAGGAPLARMLARGRLASLVLWGPPGCGKTTLARLLARRVGEPLLALSAVMAGVADLRKSFEEARRLRAGGRRPVLFIDEIHRFNRAQQDGLLHEVEDGTVTLIGATTENPSFALNAALVSRCHVLVLERLGPEALAALLARAEAHLGRRLPLADEARARLLDLADGDGRYLLNTVETLADLPEAAPPLDAAVLARTLQRRLPVYDRAQEAHFNLISALHKSVRGSDPDAALYWLCRMLRGGEDPRYIARRLVRMAVEDVGLADPAALLQARAAAEAYEQLGSPEGELALAQAVVHLALAPKSNAVYTAYKAAARAAEANGSLMPPLHDRNAPTRLMKQLGHGSGYAYDHDAPDRFAGQDHFPPGMARERYYAPTSEGAEAELARRLERLDALRRERAAGSGDGEGS
jgi:putative ATPase